MEDNGGLDMVHCTRHWERSLEERQRGNDGKHTVAASPSLRSTIQLSLSHWLQSYYERIWKTWQSSADTREDPILQGIPPPYSEVLS